jgi:uncharacterized protein
VRRGETGLLGAFVGFLLHIACPKWAASRRSARCVGTTGGQNARLACTGNRCHGCASALATIDAMTSELADVRERQPPSLPLLRAQRDEIMLIAARRGVSNIRVFGSVARGDARPDSDVDLLVDFDLGHRGLDVLGFEREVEELIGYRVEAGTEVHPFVREKVGAQAVPL